MQAIRALMANSGVTQSTSETAGCTEVEPRGRRGRAIWGVSHGRTVNDSAQAGWRPTLPGEAGSRLESQADYRSARGRNQAAHRSGNRVEDIVVKLGLPRRVVKAALADEPGFDRLQQVSVKVNAKKRYSDAEILACLQQANLSLGGILTTAEYSKYARDREMADGRPWPLHQTPSNRFGSWRAALEAAGLRSNPASAVAGKRVFSKGHCVDAILELERELGQVPTAADYERFATSMNGAVPSLATVRNRCGGSNQALRAAIRFSAEPGDQ